MKRSHSTSSFLIISGTIVLPLVDLLLLGLLGWKVYGLIGKTFGLEDSILLGALGLASLIAIAITIVYYRWAKETIRVEKSFSEQIDDINAGKPVSAKKWRFHIYENIQRKISQLSLLGASLGGETTSEGSRGGVYEGNDFTRRLAGEVSNNLSPHSAVIYFRIIGPGETIPHEAKDNLLRLARESFPDNLYGVFDDDVALYLYNVDVRVALENRINAFVSSFSYVFPRAESKALDVYSVSAGVALFPETAVTALFDRAERNAGEGKPVSFANSRLTPPTSSPGGETARRIQTVAYEQKLSDALLEAKNQDAYHAALTDLLDYVLNVSEFQAAGLLGYVEETNAYHVIEEHSSNPEYAGFSKLGEEIPGQYFAALVQAAEKETPFYCEDSVYLPKEIQSCLSPLHCRACYFYPIRYGSRFHGFFYMVSVDPRPMSFDLRQRMNSLSPILGLALISSSYASHSERAVNALDYLMEKDASVLYSINRRYQLVWFSSNLSKVFPKAKEGALCHKALFNLDSPCPYCPLHRPPQNHLVPALSTAESTLTALSIKKTDEDLSTILIAPQREQVSTSAMLDKTLQIPSARALELSLTRDFKGDTRGYLLFLGLHHGERILTTLNIPEIEVLGVIAQRLKETGLDTGLHRYGKNLLAYRLVSFSSKAAAYDLIEEIAASLDAPFTFNGKPVRLEFAYSLINYPVEVSNLEDLKSLVNESLAASSQFGAGYVAESGSSRARRALRRAYLIDLMNEVIKKRVASVYVNPIIEVSTKKVVQGDFELTLLSESRTRIHRNEFLPIAREANLMAFLDQYGLMALGNFYRDNKTGALKTFNVQGLSYGLDEISVLSDSFPEFLRKFMADYGIPRNYLTLTIDAAFLFAHRGAVEAFAKAISGLGVNLLARSFHSELGSSDALKGLGISAARFSHREFLDASESESFAFAREVESMQKLGIALSVNGVESAEEEKYVIDLGISYAMGSLYGDHLSLPEFIVALNY